MTNTKGGKKYKKHKKGNRNQSTQDTPYADSPDKLYAQVKGRLGTNRIDLECSDGIPRQGIIPGSFYKRVWINAHDILLVQTIDNLKMKECYILYKYTPDEARYLKSRGDLTFNINDDKYNDTIHFDTEYDEEASGEDVDILKEIKEQYKKAQEEKLKETAKEETSEDEVSCEFDIDDI